MQHAKARPDTGLCGGRVELGRHLVQELVTLALVDRRCKVHQNGHLFVIEMQGRRHRRSRERGHGATTISRNRGAAGEELAHRPGVRLCQASRRGFSHLPAGVGNVTDERWPVRFNQDGHLFHSHVRRFKLQARIFFCSRSSVSNRPPLGRARGTIMRTTVDHALIRGLVTAGPVMRRGASSV